MPLDNDTIFGPLYLAPAEFLTRAKLFGVEVEGWTDDELKMLLALASRAVDAHCGRTFIPDSLTETHRWNPETGRISVNQPPVMTLEAFRIRYAPGAVATFRTADVLVNNQENYLELASLALVGGITEAISSFGITEPQVEVTYRSYQAVPGAVAAATAIIAARQRSEGLANELIPAGLARDKFGDNDVSRAKEEIEIPVFAKQLLQPFRRLALA